MSDCVIRLSYLGFRARPFRGGLAFKAHTLLYHSTLGWRVIKKRGSTYSLALLADPPRQLRIARLGERKRERERERERL